MFDKKNILIDGCECEIRIETKIIPHYCNEEPLRKNKKYKMIAKVKSYSFDFEVYFYVYKFLGDFLTEEDIKMMFNHLSVKIRKVIDEKNGEEKEIFNWNKIDLESLL